MAKKKSIKISVTLQPEIKEMCDSLLTPSGFNEVAKGTYSKLFNSLLSEYLVKHYNKDLFDILEAYSKVGADETAIRNYLVGKNNG